MPMFSIKEKRKASPNNAAIKKLARQTLMYRLSMLCFCFYKSNKNPTVFIRNTAGFRESNTTNNLFMKILFPVFPQQGIVYYSLNGCVSVNLPQTPSA